MLYKLITSEEGGKKIEPIPFLDFAQLGKIEKDLEVLLASHLQDFLFEGAGLMPIFQERPMQAEADLYALNHNGDLLIFELKRGFAGVDAMLQILRYAQDAGQWKYEKLQDKYRTFCSDPTVDLSDAHKKAFDLKRQLVPSEFNTNQQLIIIGNAANDDLIHAVDYWKRRGLSVDFLPYRIYTISGQDYFEFFALPYDSHLNPASIKGVLFDTNLSYDYLSQEGGYGCLRDMLTKKRVSAYGDRKEAVWCFQPGDYVFYSHVGWGVVGAAKVKGRNIKKVGHDEYDEEWYWDVDLLTPIPPDFSKIPAMSFYQVTSLLEKSFYWARIDKRPYLSREESERLLAELNKTLTTPCIK